jgi:hypothetical protein
METSRSYLSVLSTARSNASTGRGLEPSSEWYCHCCSARNHQKLILCRICGRSITYADTPHLPLHDIGHYVLRPNQISSVLPLNHLHDTNEMKWTALHSCASIGNHYLVSELLKQGSEINATTIEGYTPLHLAAYSGSLETVAILVNEKNCNLNLQTFFEANTALHIAVLEGWRTICQYLVSVGINLSLVNALGRTPLHLAAMTGRTDIGFYFLEQKLFSVLTKDHMGWCVQQIAEFYQHRDFEELCVQFSLTDQQYKIREIPPKEWDSELWKEIVKSQQIAVEKRIKEERVYSVREDGGGGDSSRPFLMSFSETERSSSSSSLLSTLSRGREQQQRSTRLLGAPPPMAAQRLSAPVSSGVPMGKLIGLRESRHESAGETLLSPLSNSTSRSTTQQQQQNSAPVAVKSMRAPSRHALAAGRNLSFKS